MFETLRRNRWMSGIGWRVVLGASLVFAVILAAQPPRAYAAAIHVTTLADNTTTDGQCSLREAINETNFPVGYVDSPDCINGTAGYDIIYFDVTGTITVTSELPVIWDEMAIWGPGFVGDPPSIRIDGNNIVPMGFNISTDVDEDVVLTHLMITRFTDVGVYVSSNGADPVISNSYIGTNGMGALPNGSGIRVTLGSDTLIQGNLISGNTHWGIELVTGGDGTVIDNNQIGFTSFGGALPNGDGGIYFNSSSSAQLTDNWIGNHIGWQDKGIYLWWGQIVAGSTNNCLGNNYYGLHAENLSGTDASSAAFESNWWGHSSGPRLGSSGFGDSATVHAAVDVAPYLMARPAACPITRLNPTLNGSFEIDNDANNVPDNWSALNLNVPTEDSREFAKAVTGSYVMKMTGNGNNKQLRQTHVITGKAGDRFILTGWSSATSVPTSGGNYRMRLTVYCTDGTNVFFEVNFTSGTHGFEQRSLDEESPCAYNQLQISLIYSRGSGTVRFDEVHLKVEPVP